MHGATPHDLITTHGAFLRVLARSLVRDTQRAEDLVQDTFAAALTRPPARSGDLRGWLATAMQRRASNLRRGEARREMRERLVARPERVRGVDSVAAEVEFSRRLATHVEALSPPLREALFLRYFEDLPPRRIAARLGVPVATVKSRLERGLAELRSRLDADANGRREEWLGAALAWSAPRRSTGLHAALAVAALGGVALIATSVRQNRVAPSRTAALATASNLDTEATSATLASLATDERDTQSLAPRVAAEIERDKLVLSGVVEDLALGAEPSTGRPAVGVTVWFPVGQAVLGNTADVRPRPSQLSAVTDADGRFELTVTRAQASARFAELWVEGNDELRSANWQPTGGFDAGNASKVRLRRYPWGALEGHVVDPHGVPLAGIPVRIRGLPSGGTGTAVSAHDGHFRFERVRSSTLGLLLVAEQPGRTVAWPVDVHPQPRGGFEPVELVLAELAALRVHTPAPGTPVVVTPAESELGGSAHKWVNPIDAARIAFAGSDGLALIEQVAAEIELEVYVHNSPERYARRRADQLVAGLVVSSHDTRPIVVAPGETLELVLPTPVEHVPLPSSYPRREPVPGQTAKLAGSFPTARGFEPCVALHDARGQVLVPISETGARGRFVLRDLPAELVTLLVGSRGELERGEPRWTERFDLAAPQ
jgi:RNA polymerase sigma factor (sigma-70 family)